jgi:hypothetical protein
MYYKESTTLPENEVKIAVENMKDHIRIKKLKSNTLYIIKIRAGRQTDGGLNWSDYRWLRTRTLQKGMGIMYKDRLVVSSISSLLFCTENSNTKLIFAISAPKTAPKEIKAVSNGPRKIYVTWEVNVDLKSLINISSSGEKTPGEIKTVSVFRFSRRKVAA